MKQGIKKIAEWWVSIHKVDPFTAYCLVLLAIFTITMIVILFVSLLPFSLLVFPTIIICYCICWLVRKLTYSIVSQK